MSECTFSHLCGFFSSVVILQIKCKQSVPPMHFCFCLYFGYSLVTYMAFLCFCLFLISFSFVASARLYFATMAFPE